jgi:hypothetical protein
MSVPDVDNCSSPQATTEPNSDQSPESSIPPSPTSGFADIARRIRGRTTDILAIVIVVVFGLSFGGRIVEWWATDPESMDSASSLPPGGTMPWDAPGSNVSLEFGNHPYTIERQTLSGSRQQALEALLRTARPLVKETVQPLSGETKGESSLLARVAQLDVSEEEPGVWQLFMIDRPLPMVVGVRHFGGKPTNNNAKSAAVAMRRVVCWGLAFPFSGNGWRLLVFHPSGVRRETLPGLPKVQLPKTARRILLLRDARGGALIGFEGTGSGREWARHFDNWFDKHDWHHETTWSRNGSSWNGRFHDGTQPNTGHIEIQFSSTNEAQWTGLLTVIPASTKVDNTEDSTEREQP